MVREHCSYKGKEEKVAMIHSVILMSSMLSLQSSTGLDYWRDHFDNRIGSTWNHIKGHSSTWMQSYTLVMKVLVQ
jgi:hypothetical protein